MGLFQKSSLPFSNYGYHGHCVFIDPGKPEIQTKISAWDINIERVGGFGLRVFLVTGRAVGAGDGVYRRGKGNGRDHRADFRRILFYRRGRPDSFIGPPVFHP